MTDAALQALIDAQAALAADFIAYWRDHPPAGAPARTTRNAVQTYIEAAFAGDARVDVRVLRNGERPEPPTTRADLARCVVYVEFNAADQSPVCLGGDAPWSEQGAFILHVLVASHSGDALATEIYAQATRLLRDALIDGRVSVTGLIGSDAGFRFGGNWWGLSVAVEYETEGV